LRHSGSFLACSSCESSYTDFGTAFDSRAVFFGSGDDDEVPFGADLSTCGRVADVAPAIATAGDSEIFHSNFFGKNILIPAKTWYPFGAFAHL
jgi:hypothetical protein